MRESKVTPSKAIPRIVFWERRGAKAGNEDDGGRSGASAEIFVGGASAGSIARFGGMLRSWGRSGTGAHEAINTAAVGVMMKDFKRIAD